MICLEMIVDLSFDFWHETPQAELPVYISIIIIDDIAAVAGGEASKGFFLGFSVGCVLIEDGRYCHSVLFFIGKASSSQLQLWLSKWSP